MSTFSFPSIPPTVPEPQAAPEDEEPIESDAASIASENEAEYTEVEATQDSITDNPFDSELTRVLFDAIDQLQSCGSSQDLEIPQLAIVGEQSSGKSSLLQTLTDIPFPVGAGLCTRFATRIVSKRTAPNTTNKFKITIVEPEVTIKGLSYPEDTSYQGYVRVGENLGTEEFRAIMDEVSTKYMGIQAGKGLDKKNFATQVLRIELSGPTRSHFSIVDIPGIFWNDFKVNSHEVEGVTEMVVQYMRNQGNSVIYVCDTSIDVANQKLPSLVKDNVGENRLVGVFTKCDRAATPHEISSIAISGSHSTLPTCDGWFVVRNRTSTEGESFDLAKAEEKLFAEEPWSNIPSNRRGSTMLRRYLSNLLGSRIRDAFPVIQASIDKRLAEAKLSARALGKPRHTRTDRLEYLREIVERYERDAKIAMERPGELPKNLMLRNKVSEEKEKFSELMRQSGHKHQFEDPDTDPQDALALMMDEHAASAKGQFQFQFGGSLTPDGLDKPKAPGINLPVTPPSDHRSSKKRSQTRKKPSRKSEILHEAPDALFNEIRKRIHEYQTSQLPGLVNPDVMPSLFKTQTEKWYTYAKQHIITIGNIVAQGIHGILERVQPRSPGFEIVHDGLWEIIKIFWQNAMNKLERELDEFCYRERNHPLSVESSMFTPRLKALQTIRLMQSIKTLSLEQSPVAIHEQLHFSIEDNMVKTVHDILKIYYQISLEGFIRHITHIIVEGFLSNPKGPLKGLSTAWVYSLTDEELERLTLENEETASRREHFGATIARLEKARDIAHKASSKAAYLAR